MCLSAEAFALFLSLLPMDIITTTPGEITIHATVKDAHWLQVGDRWCTDAV
ncbi:hypothetical protein [Aliishimia ponticola]|uniref:hypothetical protein n=1 Tax=Aliishimia ponticola TaxID=2499833 RepID=UPI001455DD21|nr:hypothetical protein [Aliishimia ponticola]